MVVIVLCSDSADLGHNNDLSEDLLHHMPEKLLDSHKPKTRVQFGAWAFFCIWALVTTVPLIFFKASHLIALPASEVSMLSEVNQSNGWSIVHVLSEECACSRGVIEYLQGRSVPAGLLEEVVLLDGREATFSGLSGKGFEVRSINGESMCQSFGAEGVPFFQVIRPDGEVAYSGAYFNGNARGTSGFLDLSTLAQVQLGNRLDTRPVFGCPTSNRLKAKLDPFSLK